ncbi:11541_t:CDS:2 [Gigaspora rosea]|nr:11540_t:CDS:2 [Gigaspora rosea]CAG8566804.1 11541_t:CDS:2 [Gigaspora rosea]
MYWEDELEWYDYDNDSDEEMSNWPQQDEGSEPINLEEEYMVDDNWIETEQNFLIATLAKRYGWYENEEFKLD